VTEQAEQLRQEQIRCVMEAVEQICQVMELLAEKKQGVA
jgi:hypothetical protein